jgi:hypothetical protein
LHFCFDCSIPSIAIQKRLKKEQFRPILTDSL